MQKEDKNIKIEWSHLEYELKEKGNDWFWALGIIVFTSALASIIYGNYFFALFLVLSGFLLAIFSIKKPDLIFYELSEKGLKSKSILFPFKNIKSFWVETRGKTPTLFLRFDRPLVPVISFPLKEEVVEQIHDFFTSHKVPEEEMKEHISEKVMEFFGL